MSGHSSPDLRQFLTREPQPNQLPGLSEALSSIVTYTISFLFSPEVLTGGQRYEIADLSSLPALRRPSWGVRPAQPPGGSQPGPILPVASPPASVPKAGASATADNSKKGLCSASTHLSVLTAAISRNPTKMVLPLISLFQEIEDQTGRAPTSHGEEVGKPGLTVAQKMLQEVMDTNPKAKLTSGACLRCRLQTLGSAPGKDACAGWWVCARTSGLGPYGQGKQPAAQGWPDA